MKMSIAKSTHVSEAQYAEAMQGQACLPLNEIALPKRATAGSAGYDFVSPVEVTVEPGETALIPTGIRAEMDPGWVLLLFPRSSLGFKYSLRLANTVGVIDSDSINDKVVGVDLRGGKWNLDRPDVVLASGHVDGAAPGVGHP